MWTDRRALFVVAGVSLLLNAFLLGIGLGRGFDGGAFHRRGPRGGGGLINGAHVRALPPDDRRRFAASMAPHRPLIRDAREKQRAARLAVEADIAAPSYDGAKLADDLGKLRQANATVGATVDAALVEALAGLSAEGRATLVARRPGGPAR